MERDRSNSAQLSCRSTQSGDVTDAGDVMYSLVCLSVEESTSETVPRPVLFAYDTDSSSLILLNEKI